MPRRYSKQDLAKLTTEGLDAALPPPVVRKKRKNEEGEMQRNLLTWWHGYAQDRNIPECLLFAIPNGSALGHGKEEYQVKQRQIRGKLMKLEGLRPGVCDLFLSKSCRGFGGCYIEMKRPGGAVSDDQTAFIAAVRHEVYQAHVCYSTEDAIAVVTHYLGNDRI